MVTIYKLDIEDEHRICLCCGDEVSEEHTICCGETSNCMEYYYEGEWYLESDLNILDHREEYLLTETGGDNV